MDLKCRFCEQSMLPARNSQVCLKSSATDCGKLVSGCQQCEGDIGNVHCLFCEMPLEVSRDHRQCICPSIENCAKCDADNSACMVCRTGYEVDDQGKCQISDCYKYLPGCGKCEYSINELICLQCQNGKPLEQGLPLEEYYISNDISMIVENFYNYSAFTSTFSKTALSACVNSQQDISKNFCAVIANCLECKSFGPTVKCETCATGFTLSLDSRQCLDQCKAALYCTTCSAVDITKCDFCIESFIRNTYNTCQCPIHKTIVVIQASTSSTTSSSSTSQQQNNDDEQQSQLLNCMDLAALPALCPQLIPNCLLCAVTYFPLEVVCNLCNANYEPRNSGRICSLQGCSAVPFCSQCDPLITQQCKACQSDGFTLVRLLTSYMVQIQTQSAIINNINPQSISYFVNTLAWMQTCFKDTVQRSCLVPNCRQCMIEQLSTTSVIKKLLCKVCDPQFTLSLDMTFCRPNQESLTQKLQCSQAIHNCHDCENDQETGLLRCLTCIKDHYLLLLPPDYNSTFNNMFNRYMCFPGDKEISEKMSCSHLIPGCETCEYVYVTDDNATQPKNYTVRYLSCKSCDTFTTLKSSSNATQQLSKVKICVFEECQKLLKSCLQCNLDNSRCLRCYDGFEVSQDGVCVQKTLNLLLQSCASASPMCTGCQISPVNETDVTCYRCMAGYQPDANRQTCQLKQCPDRFFFNKTAQSCQRCAEQCASCLDLPSNCLECVDNRLQKPPICDCPEGYRPQQSATGGARGCVQLCGDTATSLFVFNSNTRKKECRKCIDQPINLAHCLECARNVTEQIQTQLLQNRYYCKLCMLGYAIQPGGTTCQQLIFPSSGNVATQLTPFMTEKQLECQSNSSTVSFAFAPFGFRFFADSSEQLGSHIIQQKLVQLQSVNKQNQKPSSQTTTTNPSTSSTYNYGKCLPCPETCTSCIFSLTASYECTGCTAGLTLANGRCTKADCPSGNYYDVTQKICAICPVGCSACRFLPVRQAIVCDTCISGFEKVLTTCRKRCQKRQYATADGFCADCPDQYCLHCLLQPQESEGFDFERGGFTSSATPTRADPYCAVCRAEAGYVLNPTTKQCVPAFSSSNLMPTCIESGSSASIQEEQNKFLFISFPSKKMTCFTCTGCAICELVDPLDSAQYHCTLCEVGYYLDPLSRRCVQLHQQIACGQGEYIEFAAQKQSVCERCMIADCSKCFFKEKCTACNLGYFINENAFCQRRQRCLTDQFYLSALDTCLLCADFLTGCQVCGGSTSKTASGDSQEPYLGPSNRVVGLRCTQCASDSYKLIEGNCFVRFNSSTPQASVYCPDTQFVDKRQLISLDGLVTTEWLRCLNCPQGCLGCTLLSQNPLISMNCSQCETGYIFTVVGDFYSQKPVEQVSATNNGSFSSSSSNNNTTNNNTSFSSSSQSTTRIYTCQPNCVGRTYFNPDQKQCLPCTDANCMRCIFDVQNHRAEVPDICIECIDETFVLSNPSLSSSRSNSDSQRCLKKSFYLLSRAEQSFYYLQETARSCPAHSSLSSEDGLCHCAAGLLLYSANNTCQPYSQKSCSSDQYLDDAGKCQPCMALSDSGAVILGVCMLCVRVDQCLQCAAGFFLTPQSNACRQCQAHCTRCLNLYVCLQCNKGFLLTAEGLCAASCLVGQLPLVESLYRSNTEFFIGLSAGTYSNRNGMDASMVFSQVFVSPRDDIELPINYYGQQSSSSSSSQIKKNFQIKSERARRLRVAQYSASATQDKCQPVAINLEEKSICASSFASLQQPLPYKLNQKGQPEYNGQMVTLQCVYCRYNCDACAPGLKMVLHDRSCVEECPYPLFEQTTAAGLTVCNQPPSPDQQVIWLDIRSRLPFRYGPYFAQSSNEDLVIESHFNLDLSDDITVSATTQTTSITKKQFLFEWRLIELRDGDKVKLSDLNTRFQTTTTQYDVENDPQRPLLDLQTQKLVTYRFVQNVQLNGVSRLVVPFKNLLPRVIYTIELKVSNETYSYRRQTEFITLAQQSENLDFSMFNLTANAVWGVSHKQAVAGYDWITLHYNFLSQKVLHLKSRAWKFEFVAYPEGRQFTDRWTFYHDSSQLADQFTFKTPFIFSEEQILVVELVLISGPGAIFTDFLQGDEAQQKLESGGIPIQEGGGRLILKDKKLVRLVRAASSLAAISNFVSQPAYKEMQTFLEGASPDQQYTFSLEDCTFLVISVYSRLQELLLADSVSSNSEYSSESQTSSTSNDKVDLGSKFSNICQAQTISRDNSSSSSTSSSTQQCAQRGACIEWIPGITRCECNLDYYGHKFCKISTSTISELITQVRTVLQAMYLKFIENGVANVTGSSQSSSSTFTVNSNSYVDEEQAKKMLEISKIALNIEAFDRGIVETIEKILEACVSSIRDAEAARTVLKIVDTLADIYETFDDQLFLSNPSISQGFNRNSGKIPEYIIKNLDSLKLERQMKLRQYTRTALAQLFHTLSDGVYPEKTICSGHNNAQTNNQNTGGSQSGSSNVLCGKVQILHVDRFLFGSTNYYLNQNSSSSTTQASSNNDTTTTSSEQLQQQQKIDNKYNQAEEVLVQLDSTLDNTFGTVVTLSTAMIREVLNSTNALNDLNFKLCIMVVRYPKKMISGFGQGSVATDSIEVKLYYNCSDPYDKNKKIQEYQIGLNNDLQKYVKVSINFDTDTEESKKQCRWVDTSSSSGKATLQFEGCKYNAIQKTCDCLNFRESLGIIADPILQSENDTLETNNTQNTNSNTSTSSKGVDYDYGNRPLPNTTSNQPTLNIQGSSFKVKLSFKNICLFTLLILFFLMY